MEVSIETLARVKQLAWHKTSVDFRQCLNVTEIYAHLRVHLTDEQAEKLLSENVRTSKIDQLMEWLPAKGDTWFEDFVGILRKTTDGTGHATIIDALQRNLYEVCEENKVPKAKFSGDHESFN